MADKCTSPEGHRWTIRKETLDPFPYWWFECEHCHIQLSGRDSTDILNAHASLTEKVERYNKILGAYRRFAAFVLDFAINFGELRTTGEQNKQIRDLENTARLNTQAANDWTALLESER